MFHTDTISAQISNMLAEQLERCIPLRRTKNPLAKLEKLDSVHQVSVPNEDPRAMAWTSDDRRMAKREQCRVRLEASPQMHNALEGPGVDHDSLDNEHGLAEV